MFKNINKSIFIAILLIVIMFGLVVYFAAIGYPNVLSIVVPITIFIGFWIWQKQELIKRKAESAENLLKAYWKYEKYVLTIIFSLHTILSEDSDRIEKEKVIFHLNELKSFKKLALDSELEFYLAAKIFIYKSKQENQAVFFDHFINEFSNYRYFIELSHGITKFNEDKFCIAKYDKDLRLISDELSKIGSSEKNIIQALTKKPRKFIENETLKYLSLDFLG